MAWAVPQFSRREVNEAGRTLVRANVGWRELAVAQGIVNNWRAAHSFPLNTIQMGLRDRATKVEPTALGAQRIKRLSSIESKLRRFETMELWQMQDLGGCRAIMRGVRAVDAVVALHKQSWMRHRLLREDDYIRNPKVSGYRGVHLVYEYRSDKNTTYNGLRIEVQVRSRLQHAWATAVETVGTLLKQSLKASQGEDEWLRFFVLMGSALAQREHTALVPGTPQKEADAATELVRVATDLDVIGRLRAYRAALRTLGDPGGRDADYFLLKLEPAQHSVTVTGYGRRDLARATTDYLATERSIQGEPGAEAVLVAVDSLAALLRAYPNYFLDTEIFLDAVHAAIGQGTVGLLEQHE